MSRNRTEPSPRPWIAQRLSELAKTKIGLARALGINNSRVHEIVDGTRRVQIVEIPVLARYMELPEAQIVSMLAADAATDLVSTASDATTTLGARHRDRRKVLERELEAAFNQRFCEAVAAARIASGLTQVEMADKLGINLDAYKKYEYRSPLPSYLIGQFCLHTGKSFADFLA